MDTADTTRATDSGAAVRIYTLGGCAACSAARRRLRRRGIPFKEVRGEDIADFRRMLRRRTGSTTVPQVVIDGRAIGGADSLAALDRSGALLPLIGNEQFPAVVIQRRLSLLGRRYDVRVVEPNGKALATIRTRSEQDAEQLAAGFRASFASEPDVE